MKKIKELFDAEASSPSETAILHNGAVGFRIPEYQREYDWSKEKITRLYSDCLSGFYRLAVSPNVNAFTFLGTLILVEEKTKEEDFGGISVAIVDGQQRLTTLTLLACGLYENLNAALSDLDSLELKENVKRWIKIEIDDRQADLLECAVGMQKIKGNKTYPYPKIIRTVDQRGRSSQTSEYRSAVAVFLNAFAHYANSDTNEFLPPSLGGGTDAQKLGGNYQLVRDLLKKLNESSWYEDTECQQVSIDLLNRSGCRSLLDRLADVIRDENDQNQAVDSLRNCKTAHDSVRTLLFAAYFCRCVVLTRVTTDDESAAFDIFDALNTTGEPLTALQTLKPRVIQYENSKGDFFGTKSDTAFLRLRDHLDEWYKDTTQKQRETKELLVSFALYMEGTKLSEHLAAQRNFLRTRYDRSAAKSLENARRFVSLLADMAEFRRHYWTSRGIEEIGRFHSSPNLGQVQLLVTVIKDMRSKLVLPILGRYWAPELKSQGDDEFLEVLKAVTAFLILRRAASGGTAGIDADLRAIMAPKNGSSKKFGLCAGVDTENQKLAPAELKAAFRKLLASGKFKISQKDKWVDQVIDNPLYQQAKTVSRFMLLAAAHRSMPSSKTPGCWEREGIKSSSHINNFLNLETWDGELYETVEHIAPENEPKRGWDIEIYRNTILRHSLGNLILLPKKENGAIGNDSWKRKKVFYAALTEPTEALQQQRIEDATALGMQFSNYTTGLLEQGERLALLQPLRDVKEWNRDVIKGRARNTAALTWDYVWPWLS
jgi:hypothetical protein